MSYNYLIHFGVKGMKWGRRKNVNPKPPKKPFDKKQFKEDFKSERRLGLSRADARLTAKRTQKRMAKKGESRLEARRKAANSVLRDRFLAASGMFVVTMAMRDPNIRRKVNNGAWAIGRKTGQMGAALSSSVSKIKKNLDPNLITVVPTATSRGREIVGLLSNR